MVLSAVFFCVLPRKLPKRRCKNSESRYPSTTRFHRHFTEEKSTKKSIKLKVFPENLIKMDDLGVPTIFGKNHLMSLYICR